jgi:hypothetical protein
MYHSKIVTLLATIQGIRKTSRKKEEERGERERERERGRDGNKSGGSTISCVKTLALVVMAVS